MSQEDDKSYKVNIKLINGTNLWDNTNQALNWFRDKAYGNSTFIKLDIVSIYPSIDKDLLTNALTWAKGIYLDISREEEEAIWV